MSGQSKAPPPGGPSPRVQGLEKELKELREAYANLQKEHSIMQDKCEARLNECGELLATNARLLEINKELATRIATRDEDNMRLNNKLERAYAALTAANIPLPPDPPNEAPSDPQQGGGTRKHRRRHRRKRTSRT